MKVFMTKFNVGVNKIHVGVNKVLSLSNNYKKLLTISLIFISVGAFLSFLFIPQIAKIIVKDVALLRPGSYIRKLHETKLPFTYKLYLWNITNPNEIASGLEKPKMQQVGPYEFSHSAPIGVAIYTEYYIIKNLLINVLRHFKQKIDTEDNKAEDTYSFNLLSMYHFNPHLSAPLTGDETLTILNLVLVAGIVKIKIELPHLMDLGGEGMNKIFKNPTSIFLTMTAREFIDKGIYIDCNQTTFAAKALCTEMRSVNQLKIMNDNKTILRYRWFDKRNDTIIAQYTLFRGIKNINDIARVHAINGKPMLNVYKAQEACNRFNGTDKMFFPPFQRKGDVVWAYSLDACKSLPLRYKYMKSIRGTRTAFKNLDLGDPLVNPLCECNQFIGCFRKGTVDLYPCYDLFVMGSLPHFYLAEPSIRETIEGMNPQEKLHKTGVYFDLLTGVPILAHERVQMSCLVRRIPEYPIMSSIADDDIWIPVLWYEETFKIPTPDLALLIFGITAKIFVQIIGYILICIGVIGFFTALVSYYKRHASKIPVATVQPIVLNKVDETVSNDAVKIPVATVQPIVFGGVNETVSNE